MQAVLLDHGHDVTRSPCDWMRLDVEDERHLLEAGACGRIILALNIGDFMHLAARDLAQGGIVLAHRSNWSLPTLIAALDALLNQTDASEWTGQVCWLDDWRQGP